MAKVKKVALNKTLLETIVRATENQSFLHVSDADAAGFLAHNPALIEQNPGLIDADGCKATRATEAAIAMFKSVVTGQSQGLPVTVAKPKFAIAIVDAPATAKRGGRTGSSSYPFADLAEPINGKLSSFFVPASVERPEPAKTLASLVSGATRRYSNVNGIKTIKRVRKDAGGNVVNDAAGNPIRDSVDIENLVPYRKFIIRPVTDGAAWGFSGVAGAAIYRTM